MKLKVELEREDDGRWIAEVVDLPGVLVYGAGPEEPIWEGASRLSAAPGSLSTDMPISGTSCGS